MGRQPPFISIIIPTFNAAATLERCLASVARQEYSALEVIVVDGGSSDATLRIAQAYSQLISDWRSEPDGGIYDAMNKGIDRSKGDLIVMIGADDTLPDNAVLQLAKAFVDHPADIYAGRALYSHQAWCVERKVDPCDFGALLSGIPFCHNAMYASREAYDQVGPYDVSFRLAGDAHWVHRAIRKGLSFHILDAVLVHFHAGGVSSNDTKQIMDESYRVVRSNFPGLQDEDAQYLLHMAKGWTDTSKLSQILDRYNNANELSEAAKLAALHAPNCTQRQIDIAVARAEHSKKSCGWLRNILRRILEC